MKKLIITAACMVATVSGFAQGTVQFLNSTVSAIYLNANVTSNKVTSGTIASMTGGATGPNASTGVVDVGLFWSTAAFSSVTGGTFAGIEQMSSTAGNVVGNANFALNGTTAGEAIFVQIFAWDNSFGDNLAGLQACIAAGDYFGAASAGNANTVYGAIGSAFAETTGPVGGPGDPVFLPTGNIGKTIMLAQTTTPEPATFAIGGLGAAALLFLRRRK